MRREKVKTTNDGEKDHGFVILKLMVQFRVIRPSHQPAEHRIASDVVWTSPIDFYWIPGHTA